jgi:hypothetical protein
VSTTTPTWLEKTLAAFPHAKQYRTHALLMSLAHYARENAPGDPMDTYADYVAEICARIRPQFGTDEDGVGEKRIKLILDTTEQAWEDDQKHVVFIPLALEESRTTLHTNINSKINSKINTMVNNKTNTLLDTKNAIERRVGSEDFVCAAPAKHVYDEIVALCAARGIPYHFVPVALSELARRLGWGSIDDPDVGRVGKAIAAAEAAQILVRLLHGERCHPNVPAHLRKSNIYCLRGSFETLEAAMAHGQRHNEYKRHVAGEATDIDAGAPSVETVVEPVNVLPTQTAQPAIHSVAVRTREREIARPISVGTALREANIKTVQPPIVEYKRKPDVFTEDDVERLCSVGAPHLNRVPPDQRASYNEGWMRSLATAHLGDCGFSPLSIVRFQQELLEQLSPVRVPRERTEA